MYKKNPIPLLWLCALMSIFTQLFPLHSYAAESGGVPGKTGLPDLTVTNVSFTPAKPTIKDKVTINVEIKNVGSGPAYISTGTTAWETKEAPTANAVMGIGMQGMGVKSDEVLGGKIKTPLTVVVKPGETYVSSMLIVNSGKLTPGEYPYLIKVNPDGQIEEADKNNNEQKVVLKVRGLGGR